MDFAKSEILEVFRIWITIMNISKISTREGHYQKSISKKCEARVNRASKQFSTARAIINWEADEIFCTRKFCEFKMLKLFSYFSSNIESFMDKEVTKTEAQSICGSVGMNLPMIQNSFAENEIFSIRNWLEIKIPNGLVKKIHYENLNPDNRDFGIIPTNKVKPNRLG